jgi:hypothetical protein
MTKIESKLNLYPHRHFIEHLVGAFGKSPRESDLNHETYNNPHIPQMKIEMIKGTQCSDRKGRSESLPGEAHRAQRSGKMKPGTRTYWPDGMSGVHAKHTKKENRTPDLRPGMLNKIGVLHLCSARGTWRRDPAGRGMDAHEACSAADGLSGVITTKESAALRNSVGASNPERSLHTEERWREPTSGGKSENQAENRMPKTSPVRRTKTTRDTGLTKNNYTVQKGKHRD